MERRNILLITACITCIAHAEKTPLEKKFTDIPDQAVAQLKKHGHFKETTWQCDQYFDSDRYTLYYAGEYAKIRETHSHKDYAAKCILYNKRNMYTKNYTTEAHKSKTRIHNIPSTVQQLAQNGLTEKTAIKKYRQRFDITREDEPFQITINNIYRENLPMHRHAKIRYTGTRLSPSTAESYIYALAQSFDLIQKEDHRSNFAIALNTQPT